MDKILLIQSEIGALSKTETNPFYKSKYFDINSLIAQLMPLLDKHSVTVIQPLTSLPDNSPALATIVMDGEKEICHSIFPLPKIEDPQKMGSAITYYRRYALQSLFLLQAEDDDANLGSGKKTSQNATQSVIEPSDVPFKTDTNGKLINEDIF